MKKFFYGLLAVTLLFVCAASFGNKNAIVISSSMEQFRNDELQIQLSKKFPTKNIIVNYVPTGKAASKVFAEGPSTEIDILVDLETSYLNKIKHHLADTPDEIRIPYLNEFGPENNYNKWLTWNKQAGAIIVNTEVLDKHKLDTPETYADLLKPEYKDLIVMPDPASSGTGYFFYKSWVNIMGEEAALKYVDDLHENIKTFTESGSGPLKALKQGEAAIGLGLTFQAVSEINDGQPLEIIFPPEGSPYSLTGAALIRGRENNPEIMKVYDFIVNDFLVYDKEHFSPEQIYKDQQNLIKNYPKDIPYADMHGIQDDKEKERLLNLWKY